MEEETINGVFSFFTLYLFILVITMVILSFDPINGSTIQIMSESSVGSYEVKHGFMSNFSASLAAISNIGPGFEAVGAYSSYIAYGSLSKIVLSFVMLVGRLEILPVLILFSPRTWKK